MPDWQPIETAPKDVTVILANFSDACPLTGAPHVWTATYVTRWRNVHGKAVDLPSQWFECSHAALNTNGEPSHWMPLPSPPH